jgi:hypothetical protein
LWVDVGVGRHSDEWDSELSVDPGARLSFPQAVDVSSEVESYLLPVKSEGLIVAAPELHLARTYFFDPVWGVLVLGEVAAGDLSGDDVFDAEVVDVFDFFGGGGGSLVYAGGGARHSVSSSESITS